MPLRAADDFATLLDAARDGDANALAKLVEVYEPEIRIVARVRLGAPLRAHLDTMDVVQSVHRSVLAGLKDGRFDFAEPHELVALAMTMVRRKVARKWRTAQRQQPLKWSTGGGGPLDLLVSLSGSESDPAAQAALRDRAEALLGCMGDLERQLVELRFAGCTTAEAARALGLDPDVTRVHLHRLRKRLGHAGLVAEVI